MVSSGPNLQGAMKIPMIFLKVLLYALTVIGEGVMVSMYRPTVRAVLRGQTFKANPLLIRTIGNLAPMHSMMIC